MSKKSSVEFADKNLIHSSSFDIRKYQIILAAEGEGEGYWTGGCSSLKDKDGTVYLAYRIRNPENRGYKLIIASSKDGKGFRTTISMFKQDFGPFDSLERACILQDPETEKYKLYVSLDRNKKWSIYKLEDVAFPSLFDPATAREVLAPSPEDADSRKVKDPYIVNFKGLWHMLYSGSDERPEEDIFLAVSKDGVRWKRRGRILSRANWHNYHTRVSCLLPIQREFLLFYEGSNSAWYEPHFNLNIGFALTSNMRDFRDLTQEKPSFSSPTAGNFSAVRYLDYVEINSKILFYYEAATKNGSFELRTSELEVRTKNLGVTLATS